MNCVDSGEEMGAWIYGLMARLEKPLDPDVCSSLRSLASVCARQRKVLVEKGEEGEVLNTLALFICIVAKYFGQADLADE